MCHSAWVTEPSFERQEPTLRLDSLTGLRFFAALLVVLNHSIVELTKLPLLGRFASLGYTGVTFFFLLSGFVLTWTARSADTARAFYRRRFARVYPLYLVTTIVALPICIWVGWAHSWQAAIAVLFLVQAWVVNTNISFSFNAPSWSLSCEAFFYATFPWLHRRLASTRRPFPVGVAMYAALLLVAFCVVALAPQRLELPLLYVNPLYRVGEFAIGITLGLAVKRGLRAPVSVHVASVIATFAFLALGVAGGVAHHYGWTALDGRQVGDLVMLPFFALAICAAASSDLQRGRSVFRHRHLVTLGEWSFALYLTHWLLMRVLVHVGTPHGLALRSGEQVMFVVLAICIAGAAHVFIERPMEARLRGGASRTPARFGQTASGSGPR